ncbi:hypothetical protein [Clostridium oryzae]|uniref:ABC-2 family transporter protein n=1 Tax=Clostridium oryzae TaxID=1450648 RepID=A0A1V4INN7_9CLOT|nr:hypothetical protein [Clostridium oryzae]OPJ61444.1 hypothetical protein CLORY_23100 [Clostridium oryzae]
MRKSHEKNFSIDKLEVPRYSQKKLEETVLKSKSIFEENAQKKKASEWEFLISQFFIIKKSFWILQALVIVIFISWVNIFNSSEISGDVSVYFAVFVPLFVISAIPEVWKNIQFRALEIENTTYFTLKKVYVARILIIGMYDLLLASILLCTIAYITSTPLYMLIIYFLVPFNTTCCICFIALGSKRRLNSSSFAVSLCTIWTGICYGLAKNIKIYEMVQEKLWYVLIMLSFVYLFRVMTKAISDTKMYFEVSDFEN